MKKHLSSALLALAALAGSSLSALGGVGNTTVQIFKGTVKTNFEQLASGSSQKGSYSLLVYYIQSRTEGAETLLILNPKTKVFTIEHSGAASFQLANNNSNFFNIRSIDLRDLFSGTGSLTGKVAPGTFSGVTVDFHTPKLTYQFDSFAPAPGALYLSTHDKATLKIDKAMMKLAYDGGATTVGVAVNDVINFLVSKGWVGLA
ncbi:hypothetical protein [Haloferula sp. BvORR071]|uniref:hypothetical protein n=1 Tax=Haloferula sp. BvORR071 TaxID=1396141 RepID=UPI00055470DC|nr:hypothetical protein [Haloferula sp. BvORR071]